MKYTDRIRVPVDLQTFAQEVKEENKTETIEEKSEVKPNENDKSFNKEEKSDKINGEDTLEEKVRKIEDNNFLAENIVETKNSLKKLEEKIDRFFGELGGEDGFTSSKVEAPKSEGKENKSNESKEVFVDTDTLNDWK